MNEPTQTPPEQRKATYGKISFGCFWAAAGLFGFLQLHLNEAIGDVVSVGVMAGSAGNSPALSPYAAAAYAANALLLVGVAAGIAGLVRKERPRWPAIAGLILCVPPTGMFLLDLGTAVVGQK